MTDLMLKNVVEEINHELKNGLIYVVIGVEGYFHYYKSYEPITIYSDGVKIGIHDDDDNYITLHHKAVESIMIVEV